MSVPKTMKAIKVQSEKTAALVDDAPVPDLAKFPTYILVKVSCVALNPTDWKHIEYMPRANHTVGCDYSGTVVQVGSQVRKNWQPGDRVAGFTHGVNGNHPEYGCFGEYAIAKGDIQMRIPDGMSDEEAATLGVGVITIAQGLYQTLDLPWPDAPTKDGTPILIYAGSTNTGTFAIQFAKLSGLTVYTTCRPQNFPLVKRLGATAAFDYTSPTCSADIRAATSDKLAYAYDCISEKGSPAICAAALSSGPGAKYCAILPVPDFPREDVETSYTLGYTINGEAFPFIRGREFEARPADFEFGVRFVEVAEKILAGGKIQLKPSVREGGLKGVFGGLEELKEGRVSGEKLVYRVADTP